MTISKRTSKVVGIASLAATLVLGTASASFAEGAAASNKTRVGGPGKPGGIHTRPQFRAANKTRVGGPGKPGGIHTRPQFRAARNVR